MKIKKNQKGFTLVELLVAITILGIILVIALPQLSNIQQNNKTTKYRKYADTMLTSAKLYTDSYTEDMFGNNKSGCVDIPYDDMKDKDLLKDIKVDGSTCKSDDSYIRVRKANDHYFYEVSIVCKDKNNKIVYENKLPRDACNGNGPDIDGPHISITPSTKDWTKGTNEKVTVNIWDEYGMLENTEIRLSWTKNGASYGSTTTHNFKNKRYDGASSTSPLKYEIEVPQNETGKFILTVTPVDVRDSVGNYQTQAVSSGEYKLDNTPPTKPSVNMYKWVNNDTRPTSATSEVYTNDTWSNKKVIVIPSGSTDNSQSGGIYYQYTTTGTTANSTDTTATYRNIEAEEVSYIKWRACDKLNNCSAYTTEKTVKIDITIPRISSYDNKSRDKWKNTDIIITGGATDTGGSGVAEIRYYYDSDSTNTYDDWTTGKGTQSVSGTWTAERNQMVSFIAIDYAGNVSTPQPVGYVKIDKTKPKVESISNPKDGAVTIAPLKVTLKGSEQGTVQSGILKWQYKKGTGTWTDLPNSATATYEDTYNDTTELSTYYYRLCDIAGNCSTEKSTQVFIVTACDSRYIRYEDGSDCSEPCGPGTLNRYGYSTLTSERCPAFDSTTGGSSCNKGSCITEVNKTMWDECDSYHVTTCEAGSCTYDKKNGQDAKGTVSESDLVESYGEGCGQPTCSAHLSGVNGTTVYYNINHCNVTAYGAQDGCTNGGRGSGKNDFYVGFATKTEGTNCAVWVNTDRPYSINGDKISYSGSWRTYVCADGEYCSNKSICGTGSGNCVRPKK